MHEIHYKIRAVVLNTNFYSTSNNRTDSDDDPAGQLTWLENVLTKAKQDGEKVSEPTHRHSAIAALFEHLLHCFSQVHVMLHIPPGIFERTPHYMSFREQQNQRLNNIFREYGDVILGIYAAHFHYDSFRLYYNNGKFLINFFPL